MAETMAETTRLKTVGDLRRMIEGVPDSCEVFVKDTDDDLSPPGAHIGFVAKCPDCGTIEAGKDAIADPDIAAREALFLG